MTCKHEWIKHPNNELLEMCRLCDKERTKGKESQKIPDKSLLPKIVVGMIGVVVFGGVIGYGLYKNKEPEMARCTSPKGLSPLQVM